jgi:hypothetical protein
MPCANAGRLWILRIGLYEITRSKEQADDWVWIADHTSQIGAVKCFLIVGCRLREWQQNPHPLEHRDLQVLMLEPIEKSSGELIVEQFTRVAQSTGIPRAIISDGGADLQRGIMLYRQQHPEVAAIYDITHKLARFLHKVLTEDARWAAFLQAMSHSKKQFARSSLAFLAPPLVRDQDRYMNLEELLRWATRLRQFMDDPELNDGELAEPWRVKLEFAWLRDFDAALAEWKSLLEIVEATLHFVRWEGYQVDAATQLGQRLALLKRHPSSVEFVDRILEFVDQQAGQARPDERLIGTSECLESLIGKGKRIEGQQKRSGFTAMILGMAAAVITPTREILEAALSAVKTKDVAAWVKRTFGLSVQCRRRRVYQAVVDRNKNGINALVPAA